MLRISLYSYPCLNKQKHFVFLIMAYVFSSTKLVIKAKQVLPGWEGGEGEKVRVGAGGRNDPNNVCTCE
jgi:hypothetical protein